MASWEGIFLFALLGARETAHGADTDSSALPAGLCACTIHLTTPVPLPQRARAV